MAKKKKTKVKRQNRARSRKASVVTSTLADEAYHASVAETVNYESDVSSDVLPLESSLILLYGRPKIGKTTFSSLFPRPYFLPTEPGYKYLRLRKSVIKNWAQFKATVIFFEDNLKKLSTIETFCIDTADNLAKYCQLFTCGRSGVGHPSDEEWGKGWDNLRNEWMYWMLRLANLGKGIIFICHEQEKEVKCRGMKISRVSPAMYKSCFDPLNNLCDLIINISTVVEKKKKGKKRHEIRHLILRPTDEVEAGGRIAGLPKYISFETEKEAYDKLLVAAAVSLIE